MSASSEIKLTQASLFLESLNKMGFLKVFVIAEPSERVVSIKPRQLSNSGTDPC